MNFRVLLLSGLLLGCGPLGPLPGGALDGEQASTLPVDWSFSDAYDTVQLEVRPSDPYSVNVWCVATGGALYVGAGRGGSSTWARVLLDDPRARLRIGSTLYDVRTVRVTAVPEIQAYLDGLAAKYESSEADVSDFLTDSDEPASAILFRIAP